jgi:protein PET100
MYIMFPVAIMYYYGTNLDNKFSVPDFWPKPENSNKIPFEKEEIKAELERLRKKRLLLREQRVERERVVNESVNTRREEP